MVDSSGLLVTNVSTSALVRVLIKQYQIVSFVDELGSLIDLCRHSQHTMASYLSYQCSGSLVSNVLVL